MARLLPLAALLLLLAGLGACGPSEPGDDLDRTQPQAVARALLAALAAPDLDRARSLMSEAGWLQFEEDMARFRAHLAPAPDGDARTRGAVRRRLGEEAAGGAVARVRQTGTEGTWRFLLDLEPMDPEPALKSMRVIQPGQVEFEYLSRRGVLRPIRLRQRGGRWEVTAIQLL